MAAARQQGQLCTYHFETEWWKVFQAAVDAVSRGCKGCPGMPMKASDCAKYAHLLVEAGPCSHPSVKHLQAGVDGALQQAHFPVLCKLFKEKTVGEMDNLTYQSFCHVHGIWSFTGETRCV
jgi:hypothetical protein